MQVTKHIYKHRYHLLIFYILICPNIFAQNIDEIVYPKADIHSGISLIKGGYIGSIIQISEICSFEASYGVSLPYGDYKFVSVGYNYHFRHFILNISYVHLEQVDKYFSHIAAMNIELFSITEPGFHLIGAVGGFFEIVKYFSDEPKLVGVNFNLALGFTVL